jgi:hypothetical protein
MFEEFHLKSLKYLNDKDTAVQIHDINLGLSESVTISILDELTAIGYIKQSINSAWITVKGKAYLELNSPKTKPLPIQILTLLKEQGATYNRIDIAAPFLIENDSKKRRIDVFLALEYLEKEKFIDLDGYPPSLATYAVGKFTTNKFITGIRASITKLGEKEIEEKNTETPIIHQSNINYNLEGAINTILGDNNNQSFKAQKINSINNKNASSSSMSVAMKWILATISAVVASLIVWWLTK